MSWQRVVTLLLCCAALAAPQTLRDFNARVLPALLGVPAPTNATCAVSGGNQCGSYAPAPDVCVYCDSQHNVLDLTVLGEAAATGTLSSALSAFAQLQRLIIHASPVRGALPTLPVSLTLLDLYQTALNSSVPPLPPTLQHFSVAYNYGLHGSIHNIPSSLNADFNVALTNINS